MWDSSGQDLFGRDLADSRRSFSAAPTFFNAPTAEFYDSQTIVL